MLSPIGLFEDVDFDEWSSAVDVNFVSSLRLLHGILEKRTKPRGNHDIPSVIFFSGSGTNNAPQRYSSYTVSKIALMKMTEILAAETTDCRFNIIGPGWVPTKIHKETLAAGEQRAGENFRRTLNVLESDSVTNVSKIIETIDWIINLPVDVISGRNISVVSDRVGSPELVDELSNDSNMYKLRRARNEW